MPEIQRLDSIPIVFSTTLDATYGLQGGFPIHDLSRPEIVQSSDGAEQTQIRYVNGESSLDEIKLNPFLFSLPSAPQAKEFFRAIQKWEGYVLDVGRDIFRARLVSIVGEGPDQEAEIYLEEVDPDDQELVQPGAVFYWTIGYLDRPSGRLRGSILRFRRLPALSEPELETARREAEKLESLFE